MDTNKQMRIFFYNSKGYKECKICSNISKRKYQDKNKNKIRKQKIKWKKNNPWYVHYDGARQRCNNSNHPKYHSYGGRGIECNITQEEVKELWFRDKAYNMKKPSIDRINSDGNYTFKNCQFLEMIENSRKARTRSVLQYSKSGKFIMEWDLLTEASNKYNITPNAIGNSIKRNGCSAGFIWKYKN